MMVLYSSAIWPRFLCFIVTCHFVAAAFAFNPKTNRYVLEQTVSVAVLTACVIETIHWEFLLHTTAMTAESFQVVFRPFLVLGTFITAGLGITWGFVFAGLCWKHSRPRKQDFFGTLATLLFSGTLLIYTCTFPIVVIRVFNDTFPTN